MLHDCCIVELNAEMVYEFLVPM